MAFFKSYAVYLSVRQSFQLFHEPSQLDVCISLRNPDVAYISLHLMIGDTSDLCTIFHSPLPSPKPKQKEFIKVKQNA